MKLEGIASGNHEVSVALIGADRELSLQLQERLSDIGLLEPPVDGMFGPVSHWALSAFLRRAGEANNGVITAAVASALLSEEALSLYPINESDSLAGSIVRGMQAAGHWLCRHPDCVTIAYIEGMDADGHANDNEPDAFNDLRLALRINRAGNPQIMDAWEATTEPGRHYTTIERLDPKGAARIAFGQYKSWSIGKHKDYEALVQTGPIRVHRDLNEDYQRTGDYEETGYFGINQHWGGNNPRSSIGRASAGCLVGRTISGHKDFIKICRGDPRYAVNHSYRFITTVLPAQAVLRATNS